MGNIKDDSIERIRELTGSDKVDFIDINDTFGFKCQQCGKCCMHRTDIILSPFDIYNGAKYLGIKPEEFLIKYCRTDLGANSKIPMVLLRSSSNGFCPLLKYDIKDGGKFKCMIHAAKPGACSNHPIGVMYSIDKSTGCSETRYIKVEQCQNSVSDEQQLVKDWIKPYLDNKAEIDTSRRVQHLPADYFDTREFWMTLSTIHEISKFTKHDTLSFNASEALNLYMTQTIGIGYANYDINKPFIEQAEENINLLSKFYENSKELLESLKEPIKEMKETVLKGLIRENNTEGETTTNDDNS